MQILKSNLDSSVNWIQKIDEKNSIESRYVSRNSMYSVVYLSTQTGCNQGCQMCWLTKNKQTSPRDLTVEEIVNSARPVVEHIMNQNHHPDLIHYNFMARGEPMAAENLWYRWQDIFTRLADLSDQVNDDGFHPVWSKFNISTIMPRKFVFSGTNLMEQFPRIHPEIYWSIYTVNEEKRKRWLPNAAPIVISASFLRSWQKLTNKIIKIHHAFITGVNDTPEDVKAITDMLKSAELLVNVNIVRYNPPSKSLGQDPGDETVAQLADVYRNELPYSRVDIIPRVGYDVYASCGMFA
jgi:23S rRNA (adenine2503-C2)-methyltransferase